EHERSAKLRKIYTKTGDKGTTSLIGATRVAKSHLRIEAYGTVDELNSYIGLVRDQEVNKSRPEIRKEIQARLFTIASTRATNPDTCTPALHPEDVPLLEQEIDTMPAEVPPLRSFVLPGGHQSVSFGHLARCVCRRAERLAIRLQEESPVDDLVIVYLNRLSD